MSYLVMEFVDRDFDIVDSREKADELADYYEETMGEYAKENKEWPHGSRIIIAKLVEDRKIKYKSKKDYYEMETEELEISYMHEVAKNIADKIVKQHADIPSHYESKKKAEQIALDAVNQIMNKERGIK